jgi:diguanylate cyclase (GGDEF)-like protein
VFDGLCYGVVLGMLIYNLVLFLVFRDRNYLLYLLSGSAALLTILSFNGHIAHYILPNAPVLTDRLNTILPALWIATGSWFAYEFLALKQYAPIAGKLVLLTAGVATVTAGLAAWGLAGLGQTLNENVSLVGTLVVAWGAISAWRQGFLPARLYLLGQVALFSAIFIQVLINWGWLDWPFMYDNGMQAGVAIEVMIFATALSARVRALYVVQAELIRKTEHLTQATETDALTGVFNRAGLARRSTELLVNARQRTLLMLDLDKFKPINDVYGHAAGDAMLVEIAARIRQQVRPADVVARLGGDEFAILMSEPNEREVMELICQRILRAIAQPLMYEGHPLVVGGSLGVARYPADAATLDQLLSQADVAMYHIKKNGRAGFAFYEDLDAGEAEVAASSKIPLR